MDVVGIRFFFPFEIRPIFRCKLAVRLRECNWSQDSELISFGDKICFKYKWQKFCRGATKKTLALLSMKYWLVNRDLYSGTL